jgi:hypothetical protein
MGDKKITWTVFLGLLREREHLQDPQGRNKEKRESKTVRRDKVNNKANKQAAVHEEPTNTVN